MIPMLIPESCFPLGQLVITAAAAEVLPLDAVEAALARHAKADWGELDEEDRESNNRALRTGGRLFSQYFAPEGRKFWIITECDHSATTILLPEDY
jgi:hypothetical protein